MGPFQRQGGGLDSPCPACSTQAATTFHAHHLPHAAPVSRETSTRLPEPSGARLRAAAPPERTRAVTEGCRRCERPTLGRSRIHGPGHCIHCDQGWPPALLCVLIARQLTDRTVPTRREPRLGFGHRSQDDRGAAPGGGGSSAPSTSFARSRARVDLDLDARRGPLSTGVVHISTGASIPSGRDESAGREVSPLSQGAGLHVWHSAGARSMCYSPFLRSRTFLYPPWKLLATSLKDRTSTPPWRLSWLAI